jgi:hypothetical protein
MIADALFGCNTAGCWHAIHLFVSMCMMFVHVHDM